VTWHPFFGAVPTDGATRFRVWATAPRDLHLHVTGNGGTTIHQPVRSTHDIWEIEIPDVAAGARYAYSLDGGQPRPDPASRFQPDGVHAWSEVIDPRHFQWTDEGWDGLDPATLVVYELHVGTFAGRGTFADVADRLDYLRSLGVTALELMPVADFPGRRDWGYDGVTLFAPSRAYGHPDELRALVDRAHHAGLGVILDVVYNHLGPEGAYLPQFSPHYFTDKHATPWGDAVNLDDTGCEQVRQLLIENALHWIHEYHVDGLRLDATHTLIDTSRRPFVAELAERIHDARTPRPFVFAEDHRNLAEMVLDPARGGWDLDGVWADDLHHVLRSALAGDSHGYYVDYTGTAAELAETLRRGWLFVGQHSRHQEAPRGTDPSAVEMRRCVICVQNHDQIGNRAFGDRLHHTVDSASWRAAVVILLVAPMTPLLFMGQEWAASTPFLFFTDFEPDLGRRVLEGRRREFRDFPGFAGTGAADRIPDPQGDETFDASRLRWSELAAPRHSTSLELHRALLALRARYPALQASTAYDCEADAIDDCTIVMRRTDQETRFVICCRLHDAGRVDLGAALADGGPWRTCLTTEDTPFASDAQPPRIDLARGTIDFVRAGAVILQSKESKDETKARRNATQCF
jgi:maltooligosyltrehalose trehalohydrolase